MTHSTRTFSLTDDWDLSLTSTGLIAVHDGPPATAQAVANEVRRFVNDSYFDYDQGIPHFEVELGHPLPESALRAYVRRAALRVDDVDEILEVRLDGFDRETRSLSGWITFRTRSGQTFTIAI